MAARSDLNNRAERIKTNPIIAAWRGVWAVYLLAAAKQAGKAARTALHLFHGYFGHAAQRIFQTHGSPHPMRRG